VCLCAHFVTLLFVWVCMLYFGIYICTVYVWLGVTCFALFVFFAITMADFGPGLRNERYEGGTSTGGTQHGK